MGAVQKLATVVIIGLTGLATLLVFLLADEPNRRDAEADEQEEVAIERGIQTYITNCLTCHGPAGEGFKGEAGYVGFPIGGNTSERLANQSEDPVIRAEREQIIRTRIHGGSPIGCSTIYPTVQCAMPPWGEDFGGELNDQQIEELVLMIQNVDWDLVYNEAIAASGGVYPTPPGGGGAAAAPAAPADGGDQAQAADGQTFRLEGFDIGWRTADQPGPDVEITVAPGTTIELVNAGAAPHNFSLDAKNNDGLPNLGISVDMPAGETVTAQIPADAAPGRYYFYCNVPGHEQVGMWGYVNVDPNAGGGSAPPAEEPAADSSPEAPQAATPAATPAASPAASPAALSEVTLEAWDIGWRIGDQPGPTVTLAVTPGATITIVNTGAIAHNFTIEALGISADPLAGETVTVTVPEDAAPGDYEFICAVPGHATAGMRGTITIQPAS